MPRFGRLSFVAASALVLYAAGPAIAAFLEAGDRWGPKIYPRGYHEAVYLLAWDWGSHVEQKPRVGFWFKDENRPWFHGMYNKTTIPSTTGRSSRREGSQTASRKGIER